MCLFLIGDRGVWTLDNSWGLPVWSVLIVFLSCNNLTGSWCIIGDYNGAKTHTHTGLQTNTHTHTGLQTKTHTHTGLQSLSHTHTHTHTNTPHTQRDSD